MSKIKQTLKDFASQVVDICLECIEEDFNEKTHGKKHDEILDQAEAEIYAHIEKKIDEATKIMPKTTPQSTTNDDNERRQIFSYNQALLDLKQTLREE